MPSIPDDATIATLSSRIDQYIEEAIAAELDDLEKELEALRPVEEHLRFAKRTYRENDKK